MQPLMDNLEAQTYETFEKDSVKYVQVYLFTAARNNLSDFFYGWHSASYAVNWWLFLFLV